MSRKLFLERDISQTHYNNLASKMQTNLQALSVVLCCMCGDLTDNKYLHYDVMLFATVTHESS